LSKTNASNIAQPKPRIIAENRSKRETISKLQLLKNKEDLLEIYIKNMDGKYKQKEKQ